MPAFPAPEVAKLLHEFGQRMAFRGGNPYRARAYTRAAENLMALTAPLEDLVAQNRLKEIPGLVPALTNLPPGCSFAPRCPYADERCRSFYPPYEQKRPGHWAACWHSERIYG